MRGRRLDDVIDLGRLGEPAFYSQSPAQMKDRFQHCLAGFVAKLAVLEQAGHLQFSAGLRPMSQSLLPLFFRENHGGGIGVRGRIELARGASRGHQQPGFDKALERLVGGAVDDLQFHRRQRI